ncbi:unnamed protein product, partial [Rotaria magnacalcarata]
KFQNKVRSKLTNTILNNEPILEQTESSITIGNQCSIDRIEENRKNFYHISNKVLHPSISSKELSFISNEPSDDAIAEVSNGEETRMGRFREILAMKSYNNKTRFSTTHHHVNQESSYAPITVVNCVQHNHGMCNSIESSSSTLNPIHNHHFRIVGSESYHLFDNPVQHNDLKGYPIESTNCTFNPIQTDHITHDSFTPIHTTGIELQRIDVERNSIEFNHSTLNFVHNDHAN